VQVGWFGEINEKLSLGISYRTKLYMTKFDEYEGLFAEGGEFDIPDVINIGLAYKLDPKWTVAFDYQRIGYSDIPALANSNNVDLSPCFAPGPIPVFCLGGENGLGFGWESLNVFKLGVKWDYSPKWTFRAGVSHNTDFIAPTQALFNILAPATVRTHLTFGFTFRPTSKDAINLSYAHAFKETLEGTNASITGPQTGNIFMEQNEIEIGWSHSF
jgi:long-chain fatty acid transport protein